MKILAFDTSTSSCSTVVWQDEKIIAYRYKNMGRGHAEHLMSMVVEVLKETKVKFSDLDLLAVTNGPGGFTGIRVGLAAARGISFASDLDCMCVSTLEVVANGVLSSERDDALVLAAIDSKREDIYSQAFINIINKPELLPLGKPKAVLPENLANFLDLQVPDQSNLSGRVVVTGDATARAVRALRNSEIDAVASSTNLVLDARGVASLAAVRCTGEVSVERLQPLYLRPADAKIPKNGGRLRP